MARPKKDNPLKAAIDASKSAANTPQWEEGLSSGSTLLNLACSGKADIAFMKGHYYFLVGDSSSGKTFLSLTCLAEAAINPKFNGYRFIYDNVEDGAMMDFERYFGKGMAARVEPPAKDSDGPVYSRTIQDFYFHLDDAAKAKKPYIYILDSMDALDSEESVSKFEENKALYRKGKEIKGSYGDGKAKTNSGSLRRVITNLSSTGSILIIVNQTRDNINPFTFETKTRSGGHALKFYAGLEMWSSVKGTLKKRVRGKDRVIGSQVMVKVKKNRLTGGNHTIEIPIYRSTGFDDIGSCVDFLIEEDHWGKAKGDKAEKEEKKEKGKGTIFAEEFEFSGTKEEIIQHIETEGKEQLLRDTVAKLWSDIETDSKVERKPRYA